MFGLRPTGTRWKRATGRTGFEIRAAQFFAAGLAFTALLAVLILGDGEWAVHPSVGVLVIYGFMGLWLLFTGRMMLIGLRIGDHGVLVRGYFETQTFAWAEIAEVHAAPPSVVPNDGQVVWLHLTDRRRIETTVQRRDGSTPPGQMRYAGPDLPAEEFDDLVERLDRRARAS